MEPLEAKIAKMRMDHCWTWSILASVVNPPPDMRIEILVEVHRFIKLMNLIDEVEEALCQQGK